MKILRILCAILSVLFSIFFFVRSMVIVGTSDSFGKALIQFILAFVSIIVFIFCLSKKKNNNPSDIPYEIEPINGYNLRYHYNDVDVCCINGFPNESKLNNKLYFIQEHSNRYDNKAIAIILIPQKKKLGYLYRGKLQDMANDYIRRDDKIKASITYINYSKKQVKISLSFFQKII